MHLNRRRPEEGEDPASFLSGVIWDAIRDARGAGLDEPALHIMLSSIARQCDPRGPSAWPRPERIDGTATTNECGGELEIADLQVANLEPKMVGRVPVARHVCKQCGREVVCSEALTRCWQPAKE
jgi:hypothetical protein